MNPSREEALFALAMEKPAEERAAFLARACEADAGLREKVERLLAAHEKAGAFLDQPAGGERPTIRVEPMTEEGPGTSIGRYKLLEEIGQGGFGVVYVAEQREPVKRRVALKIIKLGMDTKQVVARFEAERQALALMDHPNIAKVLDAGATETGRPYFAMELVRGIKLTEYCDQNRLSTQERLELFIKVCQAIQHAHQKGIIHRDIKPSNILVTSHDGAPVPKVIDFGIAKATQGELTDKTVYTQFQQFIGTPAYMSPEQAEMSGLDIDTRTDIYSLGVLLYELLTGSTPFDAKELMASGIDAMRRTIREQEPVRPSTRVSSMQGEERTTTAQRRGLDAPKLIHLLQGDLDWIVMKCLEKDRTRRYETANGVAVDIQRHLKNEPVVACPPSAAYRFQKLVRRNKLVFAAASAVAAALLIGLGASTWMFLKERIASRLAMAAERAQVRLRQQAEAARANEASLLKEAQANEKKATTEARKSQQVAQFLKTMLDGVGPAVALGRDTTLLKEILDKTAESLSTGLKDQPQVELDLRNTIGGVYLELGEYPKSEAMYRLALAVARQQLENGELTIAGQKIRLAKALWRVSKLNEAETLLNEVLAVRDRVESGDPEVVANLLYNLAIINELRGRLPEAEALSRETLAIRRRVLGEDHPDVAASLNILAVVLSKESRHEEAESLYRQILETRRKQLGSEHPDVAVSLHNLADEMLTDKPAEAEVLLREAADMRRKLLGNDHPMLAFSLLDLGHILLDQGKVAEAESLYREAVLIFRKRLPDDHASIANSISSLANALLRQGKLVEAEVLSREALTQVLKAPGMDKSISAFACRELVESLSRQGKIVEAEPILTDALAAAAGAPQMTLAVLRYRGDLRARLGRWKEAAQDFNGAVEHDPSDHELHHSLAPLLVQTGDLEGYRRHYRQALSLFRETRLPNVAERIAKDCLILPIEGPDLDIATQLADVALAAPTNHPDYPWFQHVKAIAEYRRGQLTEAAALAQKVLAASDDSDLRDAEACAVLAMSQHRLGRSAEARAALSSGGAIATTKLAKEGSPDFGATWLDWIIAQTLLREASQLIEGKPAGTMEPK